MDTRKLFISSIFIETLHWPGFWSIGREETPLQACRSKAGAPVAAAFSTRSSYFSACRQASRYRLAWKHIVLDHPASMIHLGSPVPRSSDSRIQRLDFKHRAFRRKIKMAMSFSSRLVAKTRITSSKCTPISSHRILAAFLRESQFFLQKIFPSLRAYLVYSVFNLWTRSLLVLKYLKVLYVTKSKI